MGLEIVGYNNNEQWPVTNYWWCRHIDYSHHVAPTIAAACRHWCTSDGDGLNAHQARKLAAELQRSIDDLRIDEYVRQLFPVLLNHNQLPCLVNFQDELFEKEKPDERRFVDEFVRQVQCFIEFLLACDGFAIL